MHADGDCHISNAVGQTLDFDARLAKNQQKTKLQTARLQVIDALCGVYTIQRLHSLQFHNNRTFDQEISGVLPDDDIVLVHLDPVLLRHAETRLS